MKFAKTLLAITAGLAFATGTALAERPKSDPGFNKLDKNNDGYLSRTEAAKNPYLAKNFKAADKNGDGKLSRTEYLEIMTAKDLHNAKEKVAGSKDHERNASTGSSRAK